MATHYSILAWRIPCGSKSQADLHSQLIPWDEAETREVRNGVFLAISITRVSQSSAIGAFQGNREENNTCDPTAIRLQPLSIVSPRGVQDVKTQDSGSRQLRCIWKE